MTHPYEGIFVVIDSLDGIGKTEVQKGILDYLQVPEERILDVDRFVSEKGDFPNFDNELSGEHLFVDLEAYDVVLTSEPTHVGIGHAIRHEIIQSNDRHYSARFTAEMFSGDRFVLYNRVNMPVLKSGKLLMQQRSVSTSIIYQPIQSAEDGSGLSLDEVLSMSGNQYALQNAPNLLIIPTIKDAEEVMRRLESREKSDNADFERLEFQLKLKPLYESENLRRIFEERGTKVEYLDAGISIGSTRTQAADIYARTFTYR